jgi:hypothetical protein
MTIVKRQSEVSRRFGRIERVAALALMVGGAALIPVVAMSQSGPGPLAPNQPRQFDYQERTGFPLAFEERVIPFSEAEGLVTGALAQHLSSRGKIGSGSTKAWCSTPLPDARTSAWCESTRTSR